MLHNDKTDRNSRKHSQIQPQSDRGAESKPEQLQGVYMCMCWGEGVSG